MDSSLMVSDRWTHHHTIYTTTTTTTTIRLSVPLSQTHHIFISSLWLSFIAKLRAGPIFNSDLMSSVEGPSLAPRLEGKVALITGGASGIGEATAKLFAKHGAKVVIADVQDHLADSVISAIGPTNSTFIHCDVSNEDHIKHAVDTTTSKYGKLDIMFNNAGISGTIGTRITDVDKADFERVMSVNTTGVFLGMKHAARVMIPARSGVIISTSSAVVGVAGFAPHAYTCSKYGVLGLTRNLAIELGAYGIRVNCVSPHGIATPLVMKGMGLDQEGVEQVMNSAANLKGVVLKVEDIANAALFLASDEAKYVSGHNLFIDGGVTISNSALRATFH